MRVQLIYVTLTRLKQFEEFLGISRIYQHLNNHNIDCRIEQIFSDLGDEDAIKKIDLTYDIFAFSIYLDSAKLILNLCKYIKEKKKEAICILGSQYATSTYKMLLKDFSYIDVVTLGKGEDVILNLVKDLDNNIPLNEIVSNSKYLASKYSIDGKEKAEININKLCRPAHPFYKVNRQLVASIVSKHGCSGFCTFCSCHDLFSCRIPDDVFDEIIDIYNSYKIQFFNFVDSTITDMNAIGKSNLKKLCLRLIEYPIKFSFRCFIRADSFGDNSEDIELLELMKDAGFSNIFVGIESGNDEDLRLYGKGLKTEDNKKCLELMKKNGFDIKYGFIMMNPFSDRDRLMSNYTFLSQNNCWDYFCYINSVQVYPETKLYNMLEKMQLLTEKYSYIDNVCGYEIKDSFAREVFEFINNSLMKEIEDIIKFQQFNYMLNYLKPVLGERIEPFCVSNEEYKKQLAEINKTYFEIIYKDNNLDKAKKEMPSYINKLRNIDDSVRKVNDLMLREFILYKKGK